MLCYDCAAGVQGLDELDGGGGARLDCCPRARVKLYGMRLHTLLVVARHVPYQLVHLNTACLCMPDYLYRF